MRVVLVKHALVADLMDEQRRALCAIEQGQYDLAHEILATRCRPADPIRSLDFDDALDVRRVVKLVMAEAPAGLLREAQLGPLQIAIWTLAQATRDSEWLANAENALTAAMLAGEYGLSLRLIEAL